jgi:hypothetical protein
MAFQKGKSGNPNGRKPGTGKRQNIAQAFQDYLMEKEKGRLRFRRAMQRLYEEDLKTFFAYAYGKPIETQVLQNPDGSSLIPIEVIEAAHQLASETLPK